MSQELESTQENQLNPRVESLAIPLARDYAEKNYPKIGEDENGEPIFKPAWRGANGEKDLRGKSPEDVAADLVADGWTSEAATAQAEVTVVDIANTPYDQFSEHWKEQNRGGAEFLIRLLEERGEGTIQELDLADEAIRNEYGDLIHNAWLTRMGGAESVATWNPSQAVPFSELSPEDKQKDVDHLDVLQTWLAEQK